MLDLDQFRIFVVIVESGSFIKVVENVYKIQFVVFMQMWWLEEWIGKFLFVWVGCQFCLIEYGECLLYYVWCFVQFNDEIMVVFDDMELVGLVWLGMFDDYVDCFLFEIFVWFF